MEMWLILSPRPIWLTAAAESPPPIIVVAPDFTRARMLSEQISPFVDGDVIILQPSELSLVSAVASSRDTEEERVGVISRIVNNDFGCAIICSPALMTKMVPSKVFSSRMIKIKLGSVIDPSELVENLVSLGYERVGTVSAPGEFASRGDVIDIYSPDRSDPIRISFFDDEVDQIKTFDLESQRSNDSHKRIVISPAQEVIISKGDRTSIAKDMRLRASEDINRLKKILSCSLVVMSCDIERSQTSVT